MNENDFRNHPSAPYPHRFNPGGTMAMFGGNSEACQLGTEEERISFTRRLAEIAASAGSRRSDTSATEALNAMRLPAIALDRRGFVLDVNAAADAVFDNDIKIKDKCLFVRDPEARALLKSLLDNLANPGKLKLSIAQPIIVQRLEKLPVIVRIWPAEGAAHLIKQGVQALVTLNALGQSQGRPQRSSPRPSVLPLPRRSSLAS